MFYIKELLTGTLCLRAHSAVLLSLRSGVRARGESSPLVSACDWIVGRPARCRLQQLERNKNNNITVQSAETNAFGIQTNIDLTNKCHIITVYLRILLGPF